MSEIELPTPEEVEAVPKNAGKKACPKCGIRYKVPYLYSHLRQVHGIYGGQSGVKRTLPNPPVFDCEQCDRTFETKHGLTMHVSLKHKPEAYQEVSKALVPVTPTSNGHREPTFRLSKEWRIVEDDEGTPFLLLSLTDLVGDRLGH